MPPIRFLLGFAVLTAVGSLHAKLLWNADFESYDTSGAPVDVVIDSSGNNDTFSAKSATAGTGLAYTAQVSASASLTGNALKLSFTNNSGASISATVMQVAQHHLSLLNGSGVFGDALVLSYDVIRSGSNGISGSRSFANNSAGSPSGGHNTTTTGAGTTRLRYTFVTNQTGAPITLPGTLGSLPHNASAGYYFSGSAYSGLTVITGVSSTDIAGFATGSHRSNSLATGSSVTVWCDNMGLWNAHNDTVGGIGVLSLPPGTVVPPPAAAVPAGLVWAADFESYDTTAGAVSADIETSGDFDTFSAKSSSTNAGLVFSAEVAPSTLTGNALKLSLSNTSGAGISATSMKVSQYHQPVLGAGALVLSYDAVRTSGNGISGSRSYAATTAGSTSGNNNTTSSAFGTTPLRYTFVVNRTGGAITLPGSLGSLATNSTAGYYYDGSTYTGLTLATGASGSSISGFATGTYRSNSLAGGGTVTVWFDNMSLWNSLSATLGGTSVLSLSPGTVVLDAPIVWHVDVATGNDSNDGRSAQTAFATIQRAVSLTQPGDTVLVHPGTYYENVLVKRGGTAAKPIRILADQVAHDRVILSGSVRAIREKTTAWSLVDAGLGLYRVPLAYRPTRVLADRADLLPYPNLNDLNAFRYLADDYPGHKHGFAWDSATQHLYVRLRADGAYGATNPNSATMAVSPPTGGGSLGQTPAGPGDYLFKLQMTGPAHIVIDGFTFETPGIAAVYTAGGDLVVRNCWFYGCRSGVAGADSSSLVDRVTVEQCYVTHFPAYSDIIDTIDEEAATQLAKSADYQKLMHWQRKGGHLPVSGGVGTAYSYESGFTRYMGDDWVVRNNHLHEVFEGLSSGSVSRSSGALVYGNRFERICDNAVETESHAQNISIHDNLLIDVFEPFSWQPREGIALPGPVYIFDNTVTQTAETTAAWVSAHYDPGLFKIGIATNQMWTDGLMGTTPLNIAESPGGFWVAHNTMLVPRGRILTALNPTSRSYKGFTFLNNIAGSRLTTSRTQTGIVFDYNFLASYTAAPVSSEAVQYTAMAGTHGEVYASPSDLNLVALSNGGLANGSTCPANGQGLTSRTLTLSGGATLTIPVDVPLRSDPGSVPFQAVVGPQPR